MPPHAVLDIAGVKVSATEHVDIRAAVCVHEMRGDAAGLDDLDERIAGESLLVHASRDNNGVPDGPHGDALQQVSTPQPDRVL